MAGIQKTHIRRTLLSLTVSLGVLTSALIAFAFVTVPTDTQWAGLLIPKQLRKDQVWASISETDMRDGKVLQPDVNTIIHVPEEVSRITRRTLFGRAGTRVRYWGYCFPQTYEEAEALKRRGFPGTIFLSEREREIRREQYLANRKSPIRSLEDLNETVLNETNVPETGAIRHQQEIFTGGMVCYVMAAEPLPVGIDDDNDTVNNEVEREHGSDPKNSDTDGDGINDGLEIFSLGTSPVQRDSDGDGLIDGVEDKNRNGRVDIGEPNPTILDTDRDGLCDGICKIHNGTVLRGEDKNLNGDIDEGETDPTKYDTDGDEISDEQKYYNCLLEGGTDC